MRPPTARSEISSAISDDAVSSRPQSTQINQSSSIPNAPVTQIGNTQYRGAPTPTGRSLISPPPLSTNSSSRPNSPTPTTSRTHVPSITAHGFLRPMSSQRLQAQRLGRQSALGRSIYTHKSEEDDQTDDAQSVAQSIGSSRQGPYASLPRGHRVTPSVTSYSESRATDRHDHQNINRFVEPRPQPPQPGSPSRQRQPPNALHLNESLHVGSIREDIQSPRSLTSGLSLGTRHVFEPGHQHLSSAGSSPHHGQKPFPNSKEGRGKNFEYFEGNTVFWFGGRIQNSRDRPINIGTGIVIVLPTVLFFIFSAPYLWHNVSPALPIVFGYLFFVCFSSFVHGSLVDPGIFPRNVHPFPPENDDPLAIGPPMNDWVMVRLAGTDTSAMDVPVKYCKTCNIWRPPRCYHCRVCDNCVETLDHHCVWLNNCVGRRNYRYFFTFVSSGTILGLYLSFASLGHLLSYRTRENITLSHSININRVPMAMFVYGIVGIIYDVALWGYHLLLTGRGETTREYLTARRFPKEERHRPFNLGNFFENWVAVFGRPKQPTYLHFKKAYEEGDQRFGSRKGNRQAPLKDKAQDGGMEMGQMPATEKSFEGPRTRANKP